MICIINDLLDMGNTRDRLNELLTGDKIPWVNGVKTAHGLTKTIKRNQQWANSNPNNINLDSLNKLIESRLCGNNIVHDALLPTHILYGMVNKFEKDDFYGKHVDRSYRYLARKDRHVRCDLSVTVFLSDPEDYEGGRLLIYDGSVTHKIKLNKGDAVIYPAGYIHEVEKVTKGERICFVTWMQSAIQNDVKRSMLYDVVSLDQKLSRKGYDLEVNTLISKIRNNLTREYCTF